MKRMLRLLLLLACAIVFIGTMAMGQIAIVNNGTPAHGKCYANPCTTPAMNTTGATLLICGATSYSPGPTCSFSPSSSLDCHVVYGASSMYGTLCYGYSVTTGASQTATCTGLFNACFASAWKGTLATSTVFDVANGNYPGYGTCPATTGSITPAGTGELLVTLLNGYGSTSTTYSINSGFTILDAQDFIGGAAEPAAVAYLVDSSSAPINPTWSVTVGSNNFCQAQIAAFKPAAVSNRHKVVMVN